jgi:hypothetical protein
MERPLNILAVDDERFVAHSLLFALSGPGRKLTIAFDSEEGPLQ